MLLKALGNVGARLIAAFGRLRQECQGFQASLSYITRSKLSRAVLQDPV